MWNIFIFIFYLNTYNFFVSCVTCHREANNRDWAIDALFIRLLYALSLRAYTWLHANIYIIYMDMYIRTCDSVAAWVSTALAGFIWHLFKIICKKLLSESEKKTVYDCNINFVLLWLCNKVIEWECVHNCLCYNASYCKHVLVKQLKSNSKLKQINTIRD